ncbi:MAG TPA: hypothetical protein PKE63_06195 [Lacibacter sp.]|nr:hypothetical protein [Lacibacter sp.]HMO89339.1 hypothetical protein [Lacibacter sp.]HMP86849.1 hypothetical protein [Lacibacter sp.]
MKRLLLGLVALMPGFLLEAQDSSLLLEGRTIQLKEIVVRSNINVPSFMQRVQEDTTFYKAFRNLRVLQFTALNDIRLLDRQGRLQASLRSRTRQHVKGGCRRTEVLEEMATGDFYNASGGYNYYTASMYASLLFAKGTVCGETNSVKGHAPSLKDKKGMDKHREQLKMLFFNPGVNIPGIPLVGNKLDIFDPQQARYYTYSIDLHTYRGELAYSFTVQARSGLSSFENGRIVMDAMTTWFAVSDFSVLGRQYRMSYNAGVYDFKVDMEVQLERFGSLVVPSLLRYVGNWDVPLRKRERGVFTATLSEFSY